MVKTKQKWCKNYLNKSLFPFLMLWIEWAIYRRDGKSNFYFTGWRSLRRRQGLSLFYEITLKLHWHHIITISCQGPVNGKKQVLSIDEIRDVWGHGDALSYDNECYPVWLYPLYFHVIIDCGHIWAPFMAKIGKMCQNQFV